MSVTLLTTGIWRTLTAAARRPSGPSAAAVAYFGQGAAKMLPLRRGSRLVVDASEGAVKSGRTCPAELGKLQRRGVRVFSVANLHAKVFVFRGVALVGSANASGRSEKVLLEAVVRTSEARTVEAVRKFVRNLCLYELTPKMLSRLEGIYRPPKVLGGGARRVARTRLGPRPALPRVFIANLHNEVWSKALWETHGKGLASGRKNRQHPRSYEADSFRQSGRCPYRRGDVVVQAVDEGRGKVLVARPAGVYHTHSRRSKEGLATFVYLELPAGKRRRLGAVARMLGRGWKKRLLQGGLVSGRLAEPLLRALAR